MDRYLNHIGLRFLKGEDLARKKADNEERYAAYFKLVSS